MKRGWFDWRGLIALVLALGVSVGLVITIWTASHNSSRMAGLTTEEAATASTVFGAIVGAVAVYLGGGGGGTRRGPRPEPPREPPAPGEPPGPGEP